MSLEAAIEQNTIAVRELIAALRANNIPSARIEPSGGSQPEPEQAPPVPVEPAKKPAAKKSAPKPEQTVIEATVENVPDAPAKVTYEDVAKVISGIAKTQGRDAALKLLAQFGVDHGSKLKSEQFAAVVEAGTVILDQVA